MINVKGIERNAWYKVAIANQVLYINPLELKYISLSKSEIAYFPSIDFGSGSVEPSESMRCNPENDLHQRLPIYLRICG